MRAIEPSRRGRVAWLSLGARGQVPDAAVAAQLEEAAEEIRFDTDVAVVVLEARSRRFFFSGAGGVEVTRAVAAVASLTQPVLAVVGAAAVADGAALALACDLRLAARGAYLEFPQMAAGRLPACGATQRLPRLIGRMRALDVLLSGRRVGSGEGERIGLWNAVVAPGRLGAEARRRAAALASKGPLALRFAKEAVSQGLDLTLEQGIRLEQDLYVLLQTTADRGEGVRSFLQRRAPKFRGE